MSWEAGRKFRGRAVVGQVQVERIGQKSTPCVAGIIEVSQGEHAIRRVRWRGWLNTPENVKETVSELQVMGMKPGAKLGEWGGIGSKEFEFTLMKDETEEKGADGKPKFFWRAAYVRALSTVNTDRAVDADDLALLNARLAGELAAATGEPRGPVPVPDATGTEEIPF